MEKEFEKNPPPYLEDLTKQCYSSKLKLISAWSGLPYESKIWILKYDFHLPEELFEKIYLEDNDYIVYLALRRLDLRKDNPLLTRSNEFISTHKNPLIRYFNIKISQSPEDYFKEPKEKRLAMTSNVEYWALMDGKKLYEILTFGIENSKINENEIYEVVINYVTNNVIGKSSIWMINLEVAYLWRLTTKVPPRLANYLCTHLPASNDHDIPSEVIEQLDIELLVCIFSRKDIEISKTRKDMFFSEKKYPEKLMQALPSHNFDLTRDEFTSLVKEKSEKLRYLACSSSIELLYSGAAGLIGNCSYHDAFRERIKCLKEWEKENEIMDFLIFKFADSDYHFAGDEFKFVASCFVKSDVWETFINLSKAIPKLNRNQKSLLDQELYDGLDWAAYGMVPPLDGQLFNMDAFDNTENKIPNLMQAKLDNIGRASNDIKKNIDKVKFGLENLNRWFLYLCAIYVLYKFFSWLI